MGKILSKVEIEKSLNNYRNIGNMDNLYREHYVVSNNLTRDTHERYCDVVCASLLAHIKSLTDDVAFDIIDRHTTSKHYNMSDIHTGVIENLASGRVEEHIAMQMKDKDYDFIGKVLDYQTPLKSKRSDEAGKIDLLAITGSVLRIIELKIPNSKESLLRCVLEAYTYFRKIHKQHLTEDFKLTGGAIVIPAVLVADGGHQVKEYLRDNSLTVTLMHKLGVEIFTYVVDANNQVTKVSKPWLNKNNYI